MKLLVDNREPKDMISLLKSRLQNVELGNLDIGDYIIKTDDDRPVMIFERKSISDLIASIKDGRYTEQSFRLGQVPINNHNIFYIIEGNMMNFCLKNKEPVQKMVFSSMLSISYKKGFSLLHTNGPIETVEFLVRFMEKLSTEKLVFDNSIETNAPVIVQGETENVAYSSVLKTAKKAHITKENIGEIMLSQIPGLSMTVAQTIMSEYKTINNLIIALTENNNCLDDFKVGGKNGARKISKPVIEKLRDFLL